MSYQPPTELTGTVTSATRWLWSITAQRSARRRRECPGSSRRGGRWRRRPGGRRGSVVIARFCRGASSGCAEHGQRPVLTGDHHAPGERRLQGQPVLAEELEGERGLRDRRDHRLDLARELVGDGPLGVAEVAAPVQHHRVAEPRLLDHPVDGGEAVLALAASSGRSPRRSRTRRGCSGSAPGTRARPAAAPAGCRTPRPGRRGSGAGRSAGRHRPPWRPAVGEQLDPVAHRHPQVTRDDHVSGPAAGAAA